MATSVKVTLNIFKAVKIMLKGGASYKEVMEFMGLSNTSVSHINHSETYEEYKHKVYLSSGAYRRRLAAQQKEQEEQEKKNKAKEVAKEVGAVPATEPVTKSPETVEHRQTIQITATHYMMQELQKTNESLKLISNKLTNVMEQMESHKKIVELLTTIVTELCGTKDGEKNA